jgi:lysyl-tRNA synthetase class 2
LEDFRQLRIDKLEKIRELGVNPYAYGFNRTHSAEGILTKFQAPEDFSEPVAVAGRIMALRRMGKASFCHIQDHTGRIQFYITEQDDPAGYALFRLLDLGDLVGLRGKVFKTRTGETTIHVERLELLAKALRPLPIVKEKVEGDEKTVYDAFADKEMRYRQRYVDLIVNSDVKPVFLTRSRILSAMRNYLEARGYIEVETPALQPVYGGAFARPFVTHHNTLDMKLFLRIADELYLKRLIVAGFDGVFEITKDFRNEGMDRDHNPEFTMMELYVAYHDYHFMMHLVEEMLSGLARQVLGSFAIKCRGHEIDLTPPWKRIGLFEAVQQETGMDLYQKDLAAVSAAAGKLGVECKPGMGLGKIVDEIFSLAVQPKLIQPTFITDYPVELSPLAKKHRDKPGLVERFEAFVAGMELCNSFSELNDPLDQRARFEEQAKLKETGDEEAMVVDEDYLRAMEYGMPPTAGLGIGIDRLTMILTDSPSIRDVILFPQMRPEQE